MRKLLTYIFIPCLLLLNGNSSGLPAAGQCSHYALPQCTLVHHIKDKFTDQEALAILPDQSILNDDNDNEDDEFSPGKKKNNHPCSIALGGKMFFAHCNSQVPATAKPGAASFYYTLPSRYILHRSIRI